VEFEGMESALFRSKFSKLWVEDKLSFFMMRVKKNQELFEEKPEEEEEHLDKMFLEKEEEQKQMPMEAGVQAEGMLLKRQKGLGEKKKETERSTELKPELVDKKYQKESLQKIKANFMPQAILCEQVPRFERVDVFEISGVKFDKLRNNVGVFESRKNYFVLFSSKLKHDETGATTQLSVFLWRGKDQKNLSLASAMNLLQEVEFRILIQKQLTLQAEAMCPTPVYSGKADKNISEAKRVENLAHKADEGKIRVVLRSAVEQDNEPGYFLQAF